MQIAPVHASLYTFTPTALLLTHTGLHEGEGGGSCRRFFRTFVLPQGSCRSGQTGLTVNQVAPRLRRFESSTPHPAGVAQPVEHQPSKLRAAGSNPVSRSGAGSDPHRPTFVWPSDMLLQKINTYNRLIVLAHSLFALPFAVWGYVLGSVEAGFSWKKLFWVLIAVVSARTSAMAFNRYTDRYWDAQNPRTRSREIPQGLVKPHEALLLAVFSAFIFLLAAWMLNPLCTALVPVALTILLGYSYTKRFTALSHFVLGTALGLAPVGAYLAVTETFAIEPILIGLAVLFWVAGFDILYALQDIDFDRQASLHSIPAAYSEILARRLALACHLLATALLAFIGLRLYPTHPLYWIGWGLFTLFVFRQHRVARRIEAINRAFFTHNGWASLLLSAFAITASLLPRT